MAAISQADGIQPSVLEQKVMSSNFYFLINLDLYINKQQLTTDFL